MWTCLHSVFCLTGLPLPGGGTTGRRVSSNRQAGTRRSVVQPLGLWGYCKSCKAATSRQGHFPSRLQSTANNLSDGTHAAAAARQNKCMPAAIKRGHGGSAGRRGSRTRRGQRRIRFGLGHETDIARIARSRFRVPRYAGFCFFFGTGRASVPSSDVEAGHDGQQRVVPVRLLSC